MVSEPESVLEDAELRDIIARYDAKFRKTMARYEASKPFCFKAKGAITEIKISCGEFVDSISFASVNNERSKKIGGNSGKTTKTLYLFIRILPSTDLLVTQKALLSFFPTKLGVIDGFYGRAGDGEGYVDAIGIYVKPFEEYLFCPSQELIITNKVNEVLNIDVPREAGPWGGNSGKPFDDGIVKTTWWRTC
ncbi:hypothetical protein Q3G72_011491 [Acer saccharum]|nr:hypothetical protein Q3G72_011491 [Acer saccharum]